MHDGPLCRHVKELAKWEALVSEAQKEQAGAGAAAREAQRAQQLAEASCSVLADLERALDAREAKLQDSWKALKAQLAHVGDSSGAGLLLLSEQRLKVRRGPCLGGAAGESLTDVWAEMHGVRTRHSGPLTVGAAWDILIGGDRNAPACAPAMQCPSQA